MEKRRTTEEGREEKSKGGAPSTMPGEEGRAPLYDPGCGAAGG